MAKHRTLRPRRGLRATFHIALVVAFALAIAGCSSSSTVTPYTTAPNPQEAPQPTSVAEAPIDSGVSEFVVAVLPRTWFATQNTVTGSSCLQQLEDARNFFNALPGVSANPSPDYGPVGNQLNANFLPKLMTSIEAMGPWCTALQREEDKMVYSVTSADQMRLQIETLLAVRRNHPLVSDGRTFIVDVYCEQAQTDSALSASLYQAFVLEQEQITRRILARNPDFGEIFRQQGVTIEQAAAEWGQSTFESPSGLNSSLC